MPCESWKNFSMNPMSRWYYKRLFSVRQLGEKAMPLIPVIHKEIFPQFAGDIWDRYRSWSYPMFIGMALDQTQINCGLSITTKK
jgi:N-sulfoglucosamine sulfohydrolase